MRIKTAVTSAAVATALTGALTASLVAMAGSADAATSHLARAGADWKAGARVVSARENAEWIGTRNHLAVYKARYVHERVDLNLLINTPLTNTTKSQRVTAARATRELNGFFHTPGLYDVAAGNAKTYAQGDWIKSARVSAADRNTWLASAVDELDSYGKRFATQRAELATLESIPLTNATAKQRAVARKDIAALDKFFNTPA
jgi:hypothetical protein